MKTIMIALAADKDASHISQPCVGQPPALTDHQRAAIVREVKDTFLGDYYGHGKRWDSDAVYEAVQELAKLGIDDFELADDLAQEAIDEVEAEEGEAFWQQ